MFNFILLINSEINYSLVDFFYFLELIHKMNLSLSFLLFNRFSQIEFISITIEKYLFFQNCQGWKRRCNIWDISGEFKLWKAIYSHIHIKWCLQTCWPKNWMIHFKFDRWMMTRRMSHSKKRESREMSNFKNNLVFE